jgi:large subunit ribosomal protein L17
MRHRQTTPKLGRTHSHRNAMLRNMVTDLLRHGRVRTTEPKAKALRPLAERMITLGKRESLHARRQAARVIRDKDVVRKLFDELAPRYAERPGGYTRIIKLPARSGDAADMAMIELVEAEMVRKERKKPRKKGGPRTAAQDTAAAAPAVEEPVEAPAEEQAAEPAAGAEEAVEAAAPEAAAEEAVGADEESSEETSESEADEEKS